MKVWIWTRRSLLVLAGMAFVACSATWAGMSDGDSPEAREVKEQFARQAGRIGSLEVSYSLVATSGLKPAQLIALSAFRNQLVLPKDVWTEAFKDEKRYRRQIQPERVEYFPSPTDSGSCRRNPWTPRPPRRSKRPRRF